MNIKQACLDFDQWHLPWKFIDSIQNSLEGFPDELALGESIWNEVNNKDIWIKAESLSKGVQESENNLIKKYPNIDKEVLCLFVKAASYSWK